MVQRLDNREICIGQLGVLAHHGDGSHIGARVGRVHRVGKATPLGEVAVSHIEPQTLANLHVKALLGEVVGDVVDGGAVGVLEDVIGLDVAEARDLSADGLLHLVVGAAHDEIWLDPHTAQLLHGVLRGLCLHLVRGGDVGHERDMDETHVGRPLVTPKLPHGLNERLTLDVADGSAELGNHDVGPGLLFNAKEALLDGVGDVRDYLHGTPEEVTFALTSDKRLVDEASSEVGVAGEVLVNEALVVAKVEVGLLAIFGHKNLTVLEGAHCAWVNVEVRVGFLHHDLVPAGFEQAPERCRRDALSKGGNNAAGYKDVLSHEDVPTLSRI